MSDPASLRDDRISFVPIFFRSSGFPRSLGNATSLKKPMINLCHGKEGPFTCVSGAVTASSCWWVVEGQIRLIRGYWQHNKEWNYIFEANPNTSFVKGRDNKWNQIYNLKARAVRVNKEKYIHEEKFWYLFEKKRWSQYNIHSERHIRIWN